MAILAQPIRIRELSGKGRMLELSNSTLPREGQETNFDMVQRVKINRYTGNAAARAQVLGVKWDPIKFGGLLEDRRIGEKDGARKLMRYMIDIHKSGRELEFNYGPIFRRVIWSELKFTTIELARIEYKCEFEVLGDFTAVRRIIKPGTREIPSTETADLWANTTLEHIETIQTSGPGAIAGGDFLDGALEQMGSVIDLEAAAQASLDLVALPGQLLNLDPALDALSSLEGARTAIGLADQLTRGFDWNLSVGLSPLDTFGVALDVIGSRTSLNRATLELLRVRDSVAQLAGAPVTGQIYIAATGDTLQRISSRFYGTVDRWQDIYTSNGLNSPTLQGGEQLLLEGTPTKDFQVART